MKRSYYKTILTLCLLLLYPLIGEAQQLLTEEMYRQRVVDYSLQLLQTKEGTHASKANKSIAFKGYLPRLDFQASASLDMKEPLSWDGAEGEYRNHTYFGQLVLTQPLYTGGGLKAKNKLADNEVQLSELTELLTLNQINYQADALYWNASANMALCNAAQKFYDIVKLQHDVIQDRFIDGMISRTDLLMISTRLKEAELQLIVAKKNHTIAMQQLHSLMGIDPNAPMEQTTSIDIPLPTPQLLPLEEVLSRRPELASSDLEIEKQRLTSKLSLSKYNPQLNLNVNGGWGTASPNFGYKPDYAALASLSLNVPILRWGERKQTNIQNQAFINIKRLQQSQVVDDINKELAGAWTKVTQSELQVGLAQENSTLAQENLDLITFSYNEGKANMVDVLSAQLSWTQAQSNVINAYLAHKLALAEYRKVIAF